jgi:integrase
LSAESDSLLFPSTRGRKLSDVGVSKALKTVTGDSDATVHGLRSTFRDWAGETTGHPREVIEHALAHQLKDKAEAAYARGTQIEKRRKLMQDWADYVASSLNSIASEKHPISDD